MRTPRARRRGQRRSLDALVTAATFVAAVVLTTLLVAAAPALAPAPGEGLSWEPPGEAPAEAVETARAAAGGLMQALLGELSAALAEGGPPAAVEVCAERAPAIARARSASGVQVGRTSLRLRNPDNAPDDFERDWLERLADQHRQGKLVDEVVRVVPAGGEDGRELRYLKPIVIQAGLCLQCHGAEDRISPEVRGALAERYPQDRAVGYGMGDFRGVVSVRVPLDR